jgi:hypothetical protein
MLVKLNSELGMMDISSCVHLNTEGTEVYHIYSGCFKERKDLGEDVFEYITFDSSPKIIKNMLKEIYTDENEARDNIK